MNKNTRVPGKIFKAPMYILFLFFMINLFERSVNAQDRKLTYDVMRNGDTIGTIIFLELNKDQKKILSLTADVKTKFIFSFSDHSEEAAAYENGVMMYSSFRQKQNGTDKANKITIASGKSYKITDNGNSKIVECGPIRYNMLLLYSTVPEFVYQVYSDNFQKLLDIKKVENNRYRLALPDGNYNYYSYKNGVCSRVDVERSLYSIQFVLRDQ
ncbi:MAG: DUF6134 family protein [Ginsengibacter sp.]